MIVVRHFCWKYNRCRTPVMTILAVDRRFCLHIRLSRVSIETDSTPPIKSPFRTRLSSRFWVYNLYSLFIYFFSWTTLINALLILKNYKKRKADQVNDNKIKFD